MQKQTNKYLKISSATLLAMTMGLTGCQTVKSLTGGKKSTVVASAEKPASAYYSSALKNIDDRNFNAAIESLKSIRDFYPRSQYAPKALLDIMYVHYTKKDYVEAATAAEEFIILYPADPQVDYAYYVRGLAHMQSTTKKFNLVKPNPAKRDTAAYRLGFKNLLEFVSMYPNSKYAPDAAQHMTYIYNTLAEQELQVARWYIKRKAYLAAAKRANSTFQYFPRSESVPEAIATLAYSNDKLGLTDLANQYKTLLQINYPEWLDSNGDVKLNNTKASLINRLTFGKLGRASEINNTHYNGRYNGQTRTQLIQNAAQLRLPANAN
ncbi:outer membrane protein assembly factor BamD [Psychrobacter sp. HD31]|uniref:outer membrane protein assembly factor BamD n=1 Tax=Psychrobacter sp. HD31 TaxID=3112003 RepID=UPI003DA50F1E